jgi:hypothetical protein
MSYAERGHMLGKGGNDEVVACPSKGEATPMRGGIQEVVGTGWGGRVVLVDLVEIRIG